MVERLNRVIQDIIAKKLLNHDPLDWDEHLPAVAFAHNVTPHSTTDVSPFYMFMGREPPVPLQGRIYLHEEKNRFEKLQAMWRKIRERWEQCQEDDKYKIGQEVLLWRPTRPNGVPKKFTCNWIGPFIITEKKNWANYVIQEKNGERRMTINASQLKPYWNETSTAPRYNFRPRTFRPGSISKNKEREDVL